MTEEKKLIDFIKKSPSCFHVVKNFENELSDKGFEKLEEGKKWNIRRGGKYFVTRNSSSILAFAIPETGIDSGFMITASHSDSPSFKIKANPEMKSAGCVKLNVEKYGGMLINPWFDRPLSLAGRVIYKKADSKGQTVLAQKLVNVDRDLLMIPNLAIHMNRDANDGHKIDVQGEVCPVLSLNEDTKLMPIVAKAADVKEKDIADADLFLVCRSEGCIWGAENEFISSPKLDDIECAFTTMNAFEAACENLSSLSKVPVCCVFDNEEVGSGTRQGADSTLLGDTLMRIFAALNKGNVDFESYNIALAKSFMVSADNAHAVHPNYVNSADPVNRPVINGGIVIKFNATQKYTTDALSSAFFKNVCEKAGVPVQVFTNNSNVAGGSTLGNISQAHVSIPCVDIGLAQWAMHSPYETAGKKDVSYMIKAITEFYKSPFEIIIE